MANTTSRNFRCDDAVYARAMSKLEGMRADGYDIDMSRALVDRVEFLADQPVAEVVAQLGLTKGAAPAKPYRKPVARGAGA